MPVVPIPRYNPSESVSGPSVNPAVLPSVRQTPDAPVAAFGASDLTPATNVAAAAISKVAEEARTKANAVAVQDAENKLSALHTDLQFGKDGAMLKKGKNALGLYESVKERWDKGSQDISTSLSNDDQRAAFSKISSNYWQNLDTNIQRHTATELQSYAAETYESGLKNQQTLAAANSFDPKQIGESVARQHGIVRKMAAQFGKGEDWITEKTKEATGNTYVEVVKAMLANDQTKTARGFFEKNKQAIISSGSDGPAKAIAIDGAIDGKMIYNTVEQVSQAIQGMRTETGMIDKVQADNYVKGLNLKPEDAYKVSSHVDHLIAVDAAQITQRRSESERSFANDLITAQASGVTYDQALKIPAKYGWDNASIAQMQAEVTKIYASPEEKFNTWITRQPQAVQSAWAEAQNTVKAKYGNSMGEVAGVKQKLADAAINELKQDVLGKSSDAIRQVTADKLKNVVVSPGMIFGSWWPNTAPGWKVDAGTRRALSEAYTLLEKDYGSDRVGQARTWLATNSKPVTPANVKKLMDSKLLAKNEKP